MFQDRVVHRNCTVRTAIWKPFLLAQSISSMSELPTLNIWSTDRWRTMQIKKQGKMHQTRERKMWIRCSCSWGSNPRQDAPCIYECGNTLKLTSHQTRGPTTPQQRRVFTQNWKNSKIFSSSICFMAHVICVLFIPQNYTIWTLHLDKPRICFWQSWWTTTLEQVVLLTFWP